MSKLILVDGNSIAYRAFYALPLLTNSSGVYTNAVYGFAMMLMKIIEEEKPTHMLVAFDAGKTTFRHESYQEYKGTRQKTPGELAEQLPLVQELLHAFQVPTYELANYEADDIIGTLAKECGPQGVETLIVSGDKDLLQLVDEHVELLLTRKGVTETERYDVQAIRDKYGLSPLQIIDLKGLMGDSSDNIPGIPGVGEKTALKLLAQYPSVEEVIAHVDELPGKKLQEKVREHQEQALLSKKLATIYTKVPLEFGLEALQLPERDPERIAEFFKKMEFKTLLSRIGKQDQAAGKTGQTATSDVTVREVTSVSELVEAQEIFDQDTLALFVEATEDNPHRAEVIGLSVSDGETQLYLPYSLVEESEFVRDWLMDPKRHKLVYDLKKTQIVLANKGIEVAGLSFDVLLAAYLLDPSESQMELSDIIARYGKEPIPSDDEVYGKGAKRKVPTGEALARHLAAKSKAIYQVAPTLKQELTDTDLDELMFGLEMPLSSVLADMERQGVHIDKDRLEELGVELKHSLDRLEQEIYELAGTTFNINSHKQLGEILFDKLGLPVLKKTKTGYSTSADVLEKLAPQHEIVEKILHYRQVGKLYSTYIEGLKKEIGPDGKIHTRFNQTVTATGRLSSTEPNLQNIPIRMEEGRRIRQVFIPSEPGWHILAADYSQIELRVLAHIAEDEQLQKAFKEDKDIHTQTAMDVFGVAEDEVTSLMRRQAKAVNFGIVYGISGFGLARGLDIAQKEAREFIDRYFETYPGVKRYMDSIVEQARRDGYVATLSGRRRYLPSINAKNFGERSFAERTAMNTPIQGTAADIIKLAMVKLARAMKERNLASRMLLQVHDELIFEVPEAELEEMKDLVVAVMEDALPLSVPLKVDVNVGETWYEAK
ncbi:DNA polymerase I [Laceyella putida]|uniref:DNA polymerase I n=1 Tax=Laceyella putida TaxID=110101 RepID=A0ABW2RPF5_9BACL